MLFIFIFFFTNLIYSQGSSFEEGFCSSDNSEACQYEINDKILTIKGNGAMQDFSSTDLPPWTNSKNVIEQVSISGITSVGSYAFKDFTSLIKLSLGDSIKSIGDYSFYGCTSLKIVTIPYLCESLGMNVFDSCSSLEIVTFYFQCKLKTMGKSAFRLCSKLKELSLPESLETVEEFVCYNCESLTKVKIPQNAKTIGQYAFAHCSSLVYFYFTGLKEPENVPSNIFEESKLIEYVKVKNEYETQTFNGVTVQRQVTEPYNIYLNYFIDYDTGFSLLYGEGDMTNYTEFTMVFNERIY